MSRYFMGGSRLEGSMGSPRGLPHGERRSSGASESCRLRRGEGYGACDDAMMDSSRRSPTSPDRRKTKPQKKPPREREKTRNGV